VDWHNRVLRGWHDGRQRASWRRIEGCTCASDVGQRGSGPGANRDCIARGDTTIAAQGGRDPSVGTAPGRGGARPAGACRQLHCQRHCLSSGNHGCAACGRGGGVLVIYLPRDVSPGRPRAPTLCLWQPQRQPVTSQSQFGPSGLRGFALRPRLRARGGGGGRLCAAILLKSSPMPAGIGCALRRACCGWQAAAAQPARRMRRETLASSLAQPGLRMHPRKSRVSDETSGLVGQSPAVTGHAERRGDPAALFFLGWLQPRVVPIGGRGNRPCCCGRARMSP
jgi:hypothetical protein